MCRTEQEFEEYKREKRIENFNINDFHFGEQMPSVERKRFEFLISKYRDIWTNSTELIGTMKGVEVDLIPTSNDLIHTRPYPQSEQQRALTDYMTNQLYQAHVIEPSDSPYSSPVLLVPKVTGDVHLGLKPAEIRVAGSQENKYADPNKWRMVVDYSRINKILETPQTPVPLISTILEQLGSSKIFVTLDLS